MNSLQEIQITVDKFMPPNSWSFHDGRIWADAMGTIEQEMNFEFLKSCGIYSERPRFIPMPNLL